MHGEHRLVGIGDALEQLADGVGVLVRNGVADGVRNVDGTCAGVDGSLDDSAEEIDLRAPGVLAGKLHVGAQAARLFHRAHCLLHHLVRLHAQLVLHVDRAGGDKGVDAPGVGAGQRFGSAFDVGIDGARQAAHGAVLDVVGDQLHRGEIAGAGDGEARLDHVYLQPLQRPGDAQLFLTGHGRAGTLLAVAQGGVEDDDAIVAAHRTVLTAAERLSEGAVVHGLSREMNKAGRRSCVWHGLSPRRVENREAFSTSVPRRLKSLRRFPPYEGRPPT